MLSADFQRTVRVSQAIKKGEAFQKGIRAPFPEVCPGPGESNPRMFAVTKGFPGQLARTCYKLSVVPQSPAVRKPI